MTLAAADGGSEGGPAPDDDDDEHEDGGNALDGLGKAWGDVKSEVGGLAEGGVNHLNVFNGDKFKDTWSNDWDIAKGVWNDPLGVGETAIWETVKPLVDSYKAGGKDEALGRSPSVLAGIIGLKGLNKLDNLEGDKPGDGDSGGDETDLTTPQRRDHILEGDDGTAGGHRPGAGKPGKPEFPSFPRDGQTSGSFTK